MRSWFDLRHCTRDLFFYSRQRGYVRTNRRARFAQLAIVECLSFSQVEQRWRVGGRNRVSHRSCTRGWFGIAHGLILRTAYRDVITRYPSSNSTSTLFIAPRVRTRHRWPLRSGRRDFQCQRQSKGNSRGSTAIFSAALVLTSHLPAIGGAHRQARRRNRARPSTV